MSAKRSRVPVLSVLLVLAAVAVGATLRLTGLENIEYKLDQAYMFERVQAILAGAPLDRLGMPSGVSLRNPGMSIWAFVAIGWLFGADTPVDLARGVAILGIAALLGASLLALKFIPRGPARTAWLWGIALASVNPLMVRYDRIIWAQSILPFVVVLMLWGWFTRDRSPGAFVWGFLGACLGQIHMSGFFFAAALAAFTFFRERYQLRPGLLEAHEAALGANGRVGPGSLAPRGSLVRAKWIPWVAGSAFGAAFMVPWVLYVLGQSSPGASGFSFDEPVQLRFYVFWISNALGLHLGHALGYLRGGSLLNQNAEFLRYPLLDGEPTYLAAAAHLLVVMIGAVILFSWAFATGAEWLRLFQARRRRPFALRLLLGDGGATQFLTKTSLIGFGLLMTATGVVVRRHYLIIAFPFIWIWLATIALGRFRRPHAWLAALWIAQLVVSVSFLSFVELNDGAPKGDYGRGYQAQQERGAR